MEDIAVIIFRVVFITILIVGFVKREQRRQTSGKGSGTGSGPAEMPSEPRKPQHSSPAPASTAKRTVVPTPAPASAMEPARQQRNGTARVSQNVEYVNVNPDGVEAMAAEYYRKRDAYSPIATAEKPSNEHADSADRRTNGREDDGGDFMERFNLRDAVLYSEILRPKFDEQA